MENKTPPKWFKMVVIVALLWNLMGILNFFMQLTITPEALASYPEAEQELIKNAPLWSMIAFALGVFGGTVGSLGLFLKKAWSKTALLISLIAVTLQMGYWVFFTQAVAVYGPSTYVMPFIVVAIAILLYRLATNGIRKGYLN
jgi:hypothetical protein